MTTTPERRLLLVHAHPDDETIGNGASMARYVSEGVGVTLVTCTLGEMGEVLVPELEHLAFERDGGLGEQRIGELSDAMKALGVTDHRFLGGAGRFHDSGMIWAEDGSATVGPDVPPNAFWTADLLVAADELVPVIREVRPQVLVTYDDFGGYGHPDHVQAHRVATYAAALAAVPSYRPDLGEAWDVAKHYWTAMSATWMREGLRALRAAGDTTTFEGMDPEGDLPRMVAEDDALDAVVDGTAFVEAKLDAMRAHATQISVDGPFFALSNNIGSKAWGREFYRLAKGVKGPVDPDTGFETDLFAGLDLTV
ncbi:MAG: N-acetyl-1-D-myo-inositol-2-amino-2-deoxy-alpha-D-glucopyranoside deacetylase [Nocardioidaceae bacterium]|nr:N-acetyl-1-D-myo-inositol-2-amino-2-deoxy-alpha-D-glucopyranoside deacetylase [Nocardioidaceae bacterium]